MSDLYSYLTQTTLKSKKKKNNKLKKRRLKWGAKGGKYNEKQSKIYNMKEDKLDKLLTLLIAQTNKPNTVELKRQQDLLSDFSIASTLQADEIAKSKMGKNKSKKDSTEDIPTDKQILAGRMEEYNTHYEDIEQGYKELIRTMEEDVGEDTIIRREAFDNIIDMKKNLLSRQNKLREELLQDIKQNPADIAEWRGFIEQSEVETSKLLELDNNANQIIFDNTSKAFEKGEFLSQQKVEDAKKNQQLAEQLLTQSQNEKIKTEQLNQQLEEAIEKSDKQQKFLSKNITEVFDKGEAKLQSYITGSDSTAASTEDFKFGIGMTGLTDDWLNVKRLYQKAPERKEALLKVLNKKREEQEKFKPVESMFSAFPPGSLMLQRQSSEDLIGAPARVEVQSVDSGIDI